MDQPSSQSRTLRVLPPKPKKAQEPLISHEAKVLPKKPEQNFDQIFEESWDISQEGIQFNDFINTPNMDEFLIPGMIPTTIEDSCELADTPQLDLKPCYQEHPIIEVAKPEQSSMENFEEAWNLAHMEEGTMETCIAPAEAEGKDTEQVFEFILPVNAEYVIEEPERLMSSEENDIVNESLRESGIAEADIDSLMASMPMSPISHIPNPIASTSLFVSNIDRVPPNLSTINIEDVPDHPANHDNSEDPQIKEDPEWLPKFEGPSSSTRVYAKKPPLHAVKKSPMKRKPGRPERQEDYQITIVPDKNCISSNQIPLEQVQELKYRRMRDLNNKASKDCRARRKNKQQQMEDELKELQKKNEELKLKLQEMLQQRDFYKKAIGQQ